jgi:glycosyltransferase involved in cell wall biosynthesis
VYDLATNLDFDRYEPVVACGGNGQLIEMLHNAGIRTIRITSLQRDISLKSEWAFARELWRILRTEKPAVFHVNSSKAGGVGALLGRLARVPRVIFTAHGWAFNEDRPWWQKIIIKGLHWLTVRLAHHTIAVSKAMKTQMNWPGTQAKIAVINPGRTLGATFDRTDARARLVEQFPILTPYQNDTWLVCVAELHPIKRHTVLFEAIAALVFTHPTLRLICIGDGQLRNSLEHWVLEHGLEKHIFLVGSVLEAARFLKAFDAFVLASKSESYGYVLHEAGLAGVPIIATNVGGIPDIITNNVTGLLVAPDDVTAIKNAVSVYLSTPSPKDQFSQRLFHNLEKQNVVQMTKETVSKY